MGALTGIRIIELVGLGPGPFAGMLLADMGAEVIAVDRLDTPDVPALPVDVNRRGKKSVILDLKSEPGREIFLKLCETADALFEGYRPGVMEKLGLGPEICHARNPRLVYARMTGWGQDGPLAGCAGHDITYIALSGALHAMGPGDRPPTVPLNLIGDYGGGGMMLAFGLVCALLEARNSGKGQVLDVSMVEGSSLLMSVFHALMASKMWTPARGSNLLDGGAPFYDCYETRDGKYIALGAIERPFMKVLIEKAGLPEDWLDDHMVPTRWTKRKEELTRLFKTRDQKDWCEMLEGSDACFAPVLPFWEAPEHPHNKSRGSFINIDGLLQPAPTPKFSRTPGSVRWGPVTPGQHSSEILTELGLTQNEIERMLKQRVVGTPSE